jgi:hypothetical protein
MPDLHVSFTLTPALILIALVFDAGLVMLAITVIRHMRDQRRPVPAADPRSAPRLPLR